MAINAFELGDKNTPPLIHSLKRARAPGSIRMVKVKSDDDPAKRGKTKKKKNSPYLHDEKIQLFSRMTEKRLVHKNNEVFSSFPMAANLYRASSDEFKALKKIRQKSKKSVLTLPNVQAPIPKACTVSDMNDSDYFNNKIDKKYTVPKRYQNNRRPGIRSKGFELYDRDAQHLESSSTDLLLKNGLQTFSNGGKSGSDDVSVQDVWSVLRNINKFQFNPPPRISDEDSFGSKKKKKIFTKKYRNRKGRRLIETCRTEEVSYVANFEISSKTSVSQSSSFDRVTVISKTDQRNEPKLDKAIEETQNHRKYPYKPKNLLPMSDRKPYRNALRNDVRPKNDNRVSLTNNRNIHTNRIFQNTRNVPAINAKRSVSPQHTIDSSNCLRLSDYEDSNCTLIPNITHPNEFRELLNNEESKIPVILENKSSRVNNDTAVSSNEMMTIGMTQMVLNNSNNVHSVLNKGLQKPKPRLVTTMPSAATMPKFTASDIKRRIAQIKFPLVVLGKDQLSSSLEVNDYDPPQFDGLNKHIWPFMLEWKKKNTAPKKYSPKPIECISTNLRKVNNEMSLVKSKDKRTPCCKRVQPDVFYQASQKKVRPMRQFKDKMLKLLYKNSHQDSVDNESTLIKPLKVNVSTEMDVIQEEVGNNVPTTTIVKQKPLNYNKKVAFEEEVNVSKQPGDMIAALDKHRTVFDALNKKMTGQRNPWAKAKWASDFVDNVMKKIKNGSYYGIEEKKALENYNTHVIDNSTVQNVNNGKQQRDTKEMSIQAVLSVTEKVDFEQNYSQSPLTMNINDDTTLYRSHDPLINIPGFDDTPPNLEITTLSSNKIQVKNCLTNVMVQFDVSLPNKQDSYFLEEKSSSSSSYIPLSVTHSNTKIYKCSTTILNTVLPAELCTVIPKLMKDIFDSTTTFASVTTAPKINFSEPSEYESDATGSFSSNPCKPLITPWSNQYHSRTEGKHTMSLRHKYWRYSPNTEWISPQNAWPGSWTPPTGWPEYLPLYISPVLLEMLNGRFGFVRQTSNNPKNSIPAINLTWSDSMILPKPCTLGIIALIPMQSMPFKLAKIENTPIQNSVDVVRTNSCTALEVYKGGKKSLFLPSGRLSTLLENMWDYCKFNIHFIIPNFTNPNTITCNRDSNNITVNMSVGDTQGVKRAMSVTITHINSLYTSLENSEHCLVQESSENICKKEPSLKCIDYPKNMDAVKKSTKLLPKKNKDKIRRKIYANLYKKCKSTSHIEGEKSSTALNKITNMEDFTQALGAAKVLCNVFDGNSSLKVLKCVEEIKLWMKDISPRQALLVLLLANKKETPNILRCRSVLLQGIAMNRITRASELDMEIEVIERENVQVAQCDGINYISATVANQDSLYEELCWIAKTTASDYQKPFDESKEKLLKSLLGKRKKLNPSYLRVMARYVGLGLLKSQNRN